MDFDDAIDAHAAFKKALANYLRNADGSLQAADVAGDDRCELGAWLRGEGLRHSHLPEFSRLVSDHRHFHQLAGALVARADAGEHITEALALDSESAFSHATTAVVAALLLTRAKAGG